MAKFRKAVITKKGLALNQKTKMRKIKLDFTKLVTGSGEYAADEELGDRTAVKEPKQEFLFLAVYETDPQTVKLEAEISNRSLTQEYYINEIGIFASDPDEGEILYSLTVAYPGKAEHMPAYDGSVPVTIALDTYQAVSDAENVQVRIDMDAYARVKDLLELKDTVNRIPENISMAVTIPKDRWTANGSGGGYYADITDPVITEVSVPILTVRTESMDTAQACGMLPTVMTMDGALRVYTRDIPEADIQCSVTLIGVAAGASGGGTAGTGYTLPVATPVRLGGVKIGDGLSVQPDGTISVNAAAVLEGQTATSTDMSEMLNEVFGATVP